MIPLLPPGTYAISASHDSDLGVIDQMNVCIESCPDNPWELISFVVVDLNGTVKTIDKVSSKPSEFAMNVGPYRFSPPAEMLAAAELQPISNRMPKLRGVIQDRSGAVIPGASIDIVLKGTQGKNTLHCFVQIKPGCSLPRWPMETT